MVFAKALLCCQDSFGCIHDVSFLVLYNIVLYYIVLHYTVLYYIANTYHTLFIPRTAVQNYVNMKFPLKSNELPINSNGFHEYMTAFRKVMCCEQKRVFKKYIQCHSLLYRKLLKTRIRSVRGWTFLRSTRLLCGSSTVLCFTEG